ncbi:hypothetical protein [Streptomyces hoynatensis]|uniref:CopG family transcriptional regulator n=1 Tax=Streptomyces hoynatensis TaxID=1141874 RepID=A0A3A9ZAW0_9ACTN|nr:hypothetical protein [Streptomyces hoynatensis]RKN45592.1 hypothetical protein D7294_03695 [Streptomyces hoynatensis]
MTRPPGTRRITVTLPASLAEWLSGYAELSHRTVDRVVRSLLEAEKARVDASFGIGADARDGDGGTGPA